MKIGRALSNYQPAFHQSHAVSKCFHRKGKGHGGVFKIEAKKLLSPKKMGKWSHVSVCYLQYGY